jgi:hypothetical protein
MSSTEYDALLLLGTMNTRKGLLPALATVTLCTRSGKVISFYELEGDLRTKTCRNDYVHASRLRVQYD